MIDRRIRCTSCYGIYRMVYTLQYIYNLPPPMHWGLRLATHRLLIRLGSSFGCCLESMFDVSLIIELLEYGLFMFVFLTSNAIHYISTIDYFLVSFFISILCTILLLIEDHMSIMAKLRVISMFWYPISWYLFFISLIDITAKNKWS